MHKGPKSTLRFVLNAGILQALAWLGGPLLGLPHGREFGGQGWPAGALSGNGLLGGGGNLSQRRSAGVWSEAGLGGCVAEQGARRCEAIARWVGRAR
jgi:hypothetical protein